MSPRGRPPPFTHVLGPLLLCSDIFAQEARRVREAQEELGNAYGLLFDVMRARGEPPEGETSLWACLARARDPRTGAAHAIPVRHLLPGQQAESACVSPRPAPPPTHTHSPTEPSPFTPPASSHPPQACPSAASSSSRRSARS
jgi:hypothetical protein